MHLGDTSGLYGALFHSGHQYFSLYGGEKNCSASDLKGLQPLSLTQCVSVLKKLNFGNDLENLQILCLILFMFNNFFFVLRMQPEQNITTHVAPHSNLLHLQCFLDTSRLNRASV